MKDTILFDLDGTLLPLDMHAFMKAYFDELTKKCAQEGYDPGRVTEAVWAGTRAMVKNDGGATNEERFWAVFTGHLGDEARLLAPKLERFYAEEFHRVRASTLPNPAAAGLVKNLRGRGYTVALATNPLFPMVANRTRLEWIGMTDTDFDLVSSYEAFRFCKPSPGYYQEALSRLGKTPAQCVMVGNDADEDGVAADLGIPVFLVTDHLMNQSRRPLDSFATGSFARCAEWLDEILDAPA